MNVSRRLHKRRTCFSQPKGGLEQLVLNLAVHVPRVTAGFRNLGTEVGMFFRPGRKLQRQADRSVGELRPWRNAGEPAQQRRRTRNTSEWMTRKSARRIQMMAYMAAIAAQVGTVTARLDIPLHLLTDAEVPMPAGDVTGPFARNSVSS